MRFIYGYNQLADSILFFAESIKVKIDGIIVSNGYERDVRGNRTITLADIKEPNQTALIIALKYVHYNDVIPELVKYGISNLHFVNGLVDYNLLQKYNDFYYRENLDVNEIYKVQERG